MIIIIAVLSIYYLVFLVQVLKGLDSLKIDVDESKIDQLSITVIIPFRNEAKNIINSLTSIENQNYPPEKFEVIYINDHSNDDSDKLLENNITKNNIKVIHNRFKLERAHKKSSIELAIKEANNEIIIITDADCTHNSNWLNAMVKMFDNNTALVSGPVMFTSDGSLFQELQQIEFSSLIIVGAGLIGSKNPIICNSANLAFRKSVFLEVGGYNDNKNLSSGDDEFLMQKISKTTNYNVKFCNEYNAIVETEPNKNLSEFIEQRKRWASKGAFYKDNLLILKLVLIFLFYCSMPINFVYGFIENKSYLIVFILQFLMKLIIEFIVMFKGQKIVYNKRRLKYFLLAEFAQIPYIIISAVLGLFGKYSWKDRKVAR